MLELDRTELKIKERSGTYTVVSPEDLKDEELLKLKSKLSEEVFEIEIKMHNPPNLGEEETARWTRDAAQAKRYRDLNITKIDNEMKLRNFKSNQNNFINCAKQILPAETFQKISQLSESA